VAEQLIEPWAGVLIGYSVAAAPPAVGEKRHRPEESGATGRRIQPNGGAVWCEPCRDLDARLRSLAAEHPDVAIRRVNIVDSDSPISRREMHGATTIPRVRLIDPEGRVVWEESGTPAVLIDGIRERIGR
jgi:thiol-disulfide isomerase/thioredoxin